MIGAKDPIDRALVKRYAGVKTCNYTEGEKISSDEMWNKIHMMSLSYKLQADVKIRADIPKPIVKLKGFWDK